MATTSAISFVRDVLFPYARRKLPGFVAAHRDDPGVRHWLDVVATEHGAMCDDAMIVETLQGWIEQDRKHADLFRKNSEGLWVLHPAGEGDVVRLESVGAALALDGLYEDVEL